MRTRRKYKKNRESYTPSDEHKEKISKAMMGNKHRLDYICTDKVKRRMSAAMRRFHRLKKSRGKKCLKQ